MTDTFYSDLPTVSNFIDITECENFVPVPDDWYILITDIIGSTKAIESGRYKDVNLIGACSIIAVLNIAGNLEIPFVFGGDGASILIPPSLFSQAKGALLGTQYFAKQEFNIDLRLGIVPVSVVMEANYEIKVAKLKVSAQYNQAIFTGGGLTYATELVKSPVTADIYNIKNIDIPRKANFSGLHCPWQDILSPHGEAISLIVMATTNEQQEANFIYKSVLEEIEQIYGNAEAFHPVIPENIKLTLNNQYISKVVKIQTPFSSSLKKIWVFLKTKLQRLIDSFLMKFKIKVGGTDWQEVKHNLVANSDYRKFDDILRMIIASNREQREKLANFLEEKYQAGTLVYGIHVSNRVLMTCLVMTGVGRDVHLVDGADGGYALAAKEMKARLNRLIELQKLN